MFKELDLILPEVAHDGAMQMALDEVLLNSVIRPTLRLYRWKQACVTFGYFQRIDEVRKMYPVLPVVRRWTGGGIVKHGQDLTFSLVIPRSELSAALPPSLFYSGLHGCIAGWLSASLPIEIRMAKGVDVCSGNACFSSPSPDDLLTLDRKILGGAQRRSAGALLYQGSLQGIEFSTLNPDSMARALGRVVYPTPLKNENTSQAEEVATHRYRTPEWTARR